MEAEAARVLATTASKTTVKAAVGAIANCTGNACIGTYLNSGVLTGVVVIWFMIIMFLIGCGQLAALQTPAFYPLTSPSWGKVEEVE